MEIKKNVVIELHPERKDMDVLRDIYLTFCSILENGGGLDRPHEGVLVNPETGVTCSLKELSHITDFIYSLMGADGLRWEVKES